MCAAKQSTDEVSFAASSFFGDKNVMEATEKRYTVKFAPWHKRARKGNT
jgi:hypothetical protein